MDVLIKKTNNSPFALVRINNKNYPILITDDHLSAKVIKIPLINNIPEKITELSNVVENAGENVINKIDNGQFYIENKLDKFYELMGRTFLVAPFVGTGIATSAGMVSLSLAAKNVSSLGPTLKDILKSAKDISESENFFDGILNVVSGVGKASTLSSKIENAFNNPILDFIKDSDPFLLGATVLGSIHIADHFGNKKRNKKYNPFVQITNKAKKLAKDNSLNNDEKLKELKKFTGELQNKYKEKHENIIDAFSGTKLDPDVNSKKQKKELKKKQEELIEDYKYLTLGKAATKTNKNAIVKKAEVIKCKDSDTFYIYIETEGGGHFLTSVDDLKEGKLFNIQEKEKKTQRTIKRQKNILITQGVAAAFLTGLTFLTTKIASTEIIEPILKMTGGIGVEAIQGAIAGQIASVLPSYLQMAATIAIFQMRKPIIKGVSSIIQAVRNPSSILTLIAEKKRDFNNSSQTSVSEKIAHFLFPNRAVKRYNANSKKLINKVNNGNITSKDYNEFKGITFAKTVGKNRFQRLIQYIKDSKKLLFSKDLKKQALDINQGRLYEKFIANDGLKAGENNTEIFTLISDLLEKGISPEFLALKIEGAEDISGLKKSLAR